MHPTGQPAASAQHKYIPAAHRALFTPGDLTHHLTSTSATAPTTRTMRTAILTIALAVCTLSAPASATPFASVPHGVGVGLGEGATVTAGVRTSALVPRAYPTGESSPEPRPQWEEGARAIGRRDGHSGGHHGSSGHAAGSKPRPTPPGSPNKDGSHAIYPRNAAFSQFHRRTRTHPAPDNIVKVASSEKYW